MVSIINEFFYRKDDAVEELGVEVGEDVVVPGGHLSLAPLVWHQADPARKTEAVRNLPHVAFKLFEVELFFYLLS